MTLTGPERRQAILDLIDDMGGVDLFDYDRLDDEDLPVGSIEEALTAGELTVDEMVEAFRAAINKSWP